MNPNPLSDREKALEDQWIREKECASHTPITSQHLQSRIPNLTSCRKQLAKDRAAKKQQAAKDAGSGSKGQQQEGQEQK